MLPRLAPFTVIVVVLPHVHELLGRELLELPGLGVAELAHEVGGVERLLGRGRGRAARARLRRLHRVRHLLLQEVEDGGRRLLKRAALESALASE